MICEDPHSSGFMVELTPDRPPNADQPSDHETSETGEASTSSEARYGFLNCATVDPP